MRFQGLILLCILFLTRCGVEVGNPGNTKPKTGVLKISFAKEPLTQQESLRLDLASLDLVEGDGGAIVASLRPTVGNVDIFGLTDGDETLVAESNTVPVGVYDRVVIRLSGEKPVYFRDQDGTERHVQLEAQSTNSFYVKQSFEITSSQTTSLLLSLDPYGSLGESGAPEKGLIFRPRGYARRHEQSLGYRSKTAVANAVWICAYGYGVQAGQLPMGPRQPPPPPPPPPGIEQVPPPPHPGVLVIDRITFKTKESIIKDTTSACPNAFAKAPVIEGRYEFRHLLPGSYSLRIFTRVGTFDDSAEDFTLNGGFLGNTH